jgi:hypothetical protein
MLNANTNVPDLAKRAFVTLDGVNDEWINGLQVESVAGGQMPKDFDIRHYAAFINSGNLPSCCIPLKDRVPLSDGVATSPDSTATPKR